MFWNLNDSKNMNKPILRDKFHLFQKYVASYFHLHFRAIPITAIKNVASSQQEEFVRLDNLIMRLKVNMHRFKHVHGL